MIAFYLSMEHRAERMDGCPFVALGGDAARQHADVRASFEAGIRQHLETLARWVDDAEGEEPTGRAMAILAMMVGAMLLSRSVNDERLSKQLLDAAANSVVRAASITVNEMARTLARLLHKNIAPEVLEKYRVGDIRHCFSDVSKARAVLGFEPKRAFDEGMAELIDWVRTATKPVDRSSESLAELDRKRLVI